MCVKNFDNETKVCVLTNARYGTSAHVGQHGVIKGKWSGLLLVEFSDGHQRYFGEDDLKHE